MNTHDTQWRIRNKYTTDPKRIRIASGNSKQTSIMRQLYSIILSLLTIAILETKTPNDRMFNQSFRFFANIFLESFL